MPEGSSTDPVRVIIVDDHLVVRDGIRLSLNSFEGIQIIGEAESGEQALPLCRETGPDTIVLDLSMGETDETGAIRQIANMFPRVRIIALNGSENARVEEMARQAGAWLCLSKQVGINELATAILSSRDQRRQSMFDGNEGKQNG